MNHPVLLLNSTVIRMAFLLLCMTFASLPGLADTFFFTTGNPDGKLGTLSRPGFSELPQTETADDFILSQPTSIQNATFTGLLAPGPLRSSGNITQVEIEFYDVFPADSVNPPSGKVPTRINSPADKEIGSATRNSAIATLSFSASVLNPSFVVASSIVNRIGPMQPGGEGPVTGEEVLINVSFSPGVLLPPGHYFFRPEAALSSGDFLWLSAPKPIVSPAGTPFNPDFQSWIRNDVVAPDWLRTGTDIIGQTTFNAAFSLTGQAVPEPASLGIFSAGLGAVLGLLFFGRRGRSISIRSFGIKKA